MRGVPSGGSRGLARPRVTVLYNLPATERGSAEHESEAGVLESVQASLEALVALGYDARIFGLGAGGLGAGLGATLAELSRELEGTDRPDVVLNFCEGFAGDSALEAAVAGALELAGVPYTGSPPIALAVAQRKALAKRLFLGAGLPTPEFRAIESRAAWSPLEFEDWLAAGPLVVKPAAEDASLGLSQASIVTTRAALELQVESLRARFGDVLVERFVDGRELNVGVLAAPVPRPLPIAEIVFADDPRVPWRLVTYDAKWHPDSPDYLATPPVCPAELDPSLAREVEQLALAAFELLGCRDYARVDLRLDAEGRPWLLEVNPNPDLAPGAGFARAARVAGRSYSDLIEALVEGALRRGASPGHPEVTTDAGLLRPAPAPPRPAAELVELDPARVDELAQLLVRTGAFRPDEVEVGREVLEDAARLGAASHYRVRVARSADRVAGWAAFGPVPMTKSTFDLYWIAVDPDWQGAGVGTHLLEDCEARVSAAGGDWLLAETSTSAAYAATRAFYLRRGYALLSSIPDYYAAGDGRAIFGKRLARAAAPDAHVSRMRQAVPQA